MLQSLRSDTPSSRIELSRQLGINNGVVTRLSRELIALGLVVEAEAQLGSRGRPSLPLHLRAEGAYAIGAATHPGFVDICVVDFVGNLLASKCIQWGESEPDAFADMIAHEVTAITERLALRRSRFLGFGVSVPGFAIGSSSQRHTVERMRSWRGLDLSERLGTVLGGPVWIENDANAAAIAEYYDSQGSSGSSMLVLFLSFGVGGGCISAGQIFGGEHGNAGEIGAFYPLNQPRPSAIDLVATLQATSGKMIDLQNLSEHIADCSEAINAWIDRAASQLELAVLSGIAWFDPANVVVSGALPGEILEPLADRLRNCAWETRLGLRKVPSISASRLMGRAAAIGAAFLPIHHTIAPSR